MQLVVPPNSTLVQDCLVDQGKAGLLITRMWVMLVILKDLLLAIFWLGFCISALVGL